MDKIPPEIKEQFKKDAEAHADFLVENVFRPAFIMAFIHGAKHGYEHQIVERFYKENPRGFAETFTSTDKAAARAHFDRIRADHI